MSATGYYWAHKGDGETYAVQVEGEQVIAACGPLYYREVTAANLEAWNFDGEPELTEWVNEHQDEFGLVEPPYRGDEYANEEAS